MTQEQLEVVGVSQPRSGLRAKLTGAAMYTADLHRPGMLYGRVLRSPHPHARIASIDASEALRLPGVQAILTYRDVSDARIDADLLVLDRVLRFVGDEVAVVAAERESIAEDALSLIKVVYEPLTPVFDAEAALSDDSPVLHTLASTTTLTSGGTAEVRKSGAAEVKNKNLVGGEPLRVERGDVEAGLASSAQVYSGHFHTQMHGPVGMETRAALAEWDGDRLTLWKTSRAIHAVDRRALVRVLGIPLENVRVICTTMGGGFGNKDEGRVGFLAALLARKTGRPVRIEYSRVEEFVGGRNRQETDIDVSIGVAEDGSPVAVDMSATMNAGAYVASGMGVTRRIGQGALYLYTSPNARFTGLTAYTNRPAGGSFRGLGAPLGHFALEVLIDQIAAARGEDPLDYRLKHHVTPAGQPGLRTTPLHEMVPDQPVEGGVPFSSNGLRQCILAGAERIAWRQRRQPNASSGGELRRGPSTGLRTGLGMAIGTYKGGAGPSGEAVLRLSPDGSVELAVGVVDVGNGSETVLAQIAAESLGLPLSRVSVTMADTAVTPPGHTVAGSSTTLTTGAAVKLAAEDARRQLVERARSLESAAEPSRQDVTSLLRGMNEHVVGTAAFTSGSTDFVINSFCAHFAEVEVDTLTGRVRILRYVAAHDSGRIINPALAENQVSGGVLQFLGIAMREELLMDRETGVTLNAGFLEHKSTSMVDFPPIEVIFAGEADPIGPYGAKALGEPPVVPVFAAVANAIANATGAWLHEVPFTQARVLAALRNVGLTS